MFMNSVAQHCAQTVSNLCQTLLFTLLCIILTRPYAVPIDFLTAIWNCEFLHFALITHGTDSDVAKPRLRSGESWKRVSWFVCGMSDKVTARERNTVSNIYHQWANLALIWMLDARVLKYLRHTCFAKATPPHLEWSLQSQMELPRQSPQSCARERIAIAKPDIAPVLLPGHSRMHFSLLFMVFFHALTRRRSALEFNTFKLQIPSTDLQLHCAYFPPAPKHQHKNNAMP